MSIGGYLSHDDYENPSKLIKRFRSFDDKIGKMLSLNIYVCKLSLSDLYWVSINPHREPSNHIMTGDNAVDLHSYPIEEAQSLADKLANKIRELGLEVTVQTDDGKPATAEDIAEVQKQLSEWQV